MSGWHEPARVPYKVRDVRPWAARRPAQAISCSRLRFSARRYLPLRRGQAPTLPLHHSPVGAAPLATDVRAFFEPRFGHDFGDVRIHTGATAARAGDEIQARAFTLGRDIAFGRGEYAPRTSAGRRLMARVSTPNSQLPISKEPECFGSWELDVGLDAVLGSVSSLPSLRPLRLRPVRWHLLR